MTMNTLQHKSYLLIIEDQKSMVMIVKSKLRLAHCQCQILVAHTLAEAENLIQKYPEQIKLGLADLHLPDAPNGEAVDLLAQHNITTVVLTSTYDEATRERMYRKRVADYVIKDGEASINYAVHSLLKILSNEQRSIWLVSSLNKSMNKIQGLLSIQRYSLKSFFSFQDLLYALDEKKPDLILVIDALHITDSNAFKSMSDIRQNYSISELPIISCEPTEHLSTAIKLMKYGINDFFNTGFSTEELYIRVNQSIDQAVAFREIKKVSQTDPLTGLYNRRHFFHLANQFIDQNHKQFIIMADIDFFKKVNDTHGHQKGDDAIQFTANHIRQIFSDHLYARFGGEEFCIFGAYKTRQDILALAEMLREELQQNAPKLLGFPLTLSLGVSFKVSNIERGIAHADEALYQAKQNGRNRVSHCQIELEAS